MSNLSKKVKFATYVRGQYFLVLIQCFIAKQNYLPYINQGTIVPTGITHAKKSLFKNQ